MRWNLEAFSERARYRPMSIALMLAAHLMLAGILVGIPDWICFLVAASLLIALAIITYHRLRNGSCAGAWVWLMILPFGIGPTWHLSGYLTVNILGLITSVVPVILAWLAPANSGENPQPESA